MSNDRNPEGRFSRRPPIPPTVPFPETDDSRGATVEEIEAFLEHLKALVSGAVAIDADSVDVVAALCVLAQEHEPIRLKTIELMEAKIRSHGLQPPVQVDAEPAPPKPRPIVFREGDAETLVRNMDELAAFCAERNLEIPAGATFEQIAAAIETEHRHEPPS